MEQKPEAWSSSDIKERLSNLFEEEEVTLSDAQWAYREAAAVLAYYELHTLKPARPVDGGDASTAICSDGEIAYDESGDTRWTLRGGVRRETLKRMSREQIRQALAANPERPSSIIQRMLEAYLLGEAKPLTGQSLDELRATVRVSEMLGDAAATLPAPGELAYQLERETLLAPMRGLVGDHFAGRTRELGLLSDSVGVFDASSKGEAARRSFDNVFSVAQRLPLSIHGPGGIGKSTLVAKFILNHADLPMERRIPFAYLDFDRPGLIGEEPITLIFEALRQLASQYPESKPQADELRQRWTRHVADAASGGARTSGWTKLRLSDRDNYLEGFGIYVDSLKTHDQPLLFVLDTFEEIQLRSQAVVEEVFAFLDHLQQRIPRLRTVLSGRVEAKSERYAVDPLPLTVFDPASARAFLTMKVSGLQAGVAEKVVAQVGGSPLTLKLAADLLKQEPAGPDGLKDLRTGILARLRGETIQSQLYTRILKHIRDEDVRKLAHPGLILRRITPEIIRDVLAGPCDVVVPDLATARSLFERMEKQVVLVTSPSPDVLLHRPDLRAVMIEPLRASKKDKVEEIHRAAVKYYERFDDADSRAEEIYHRLSLGLDRHAVLSRWMDGLKKGLAGSVSELAPAAQAFLAARLDLEIPKELWTQAEQADWELYAEKRAREHLLLQKPEEALALLQQRPRSGWSRVLRSIEVDALMQLGRTDEAKHALSQAGHGAGAETHAHAMDVDTRLMEQTELLRGAKPVDQFGGRPLRVLIDALTDAFPSQQQLAELLNTLDSHFSEVKPTGTIQDAVFHVIQAAGSRGLVGDLLVAARNANPGNKRLFALAQDTGLTAVPDGWQIDEHLERTGRPLVPESFRRRLTRIERCLCQIEASTPGQPLRATGFLVNADVLLTSYAAVERLITRSPSEPAPPVNVRFDHRQGRGDVHSSGSGCKLAEQWLIDAMPADRSNTGSGYALLRLDGQPGLTRWARELRGWFPIRDAKAGWPKSAALAYCGADAAPHIVFNVPRIEEESGPDRFRLPSAPMTGALGAVVLDERLQLTSMVVAANPSAGAEAVSIDRIARTIVNRGHGDALGGDPSRHAASSA